MEPTAAAAIKSAAAAVKFITIIKFDTAAAAKSSTSIKFETTATNIDTTTTNLDSTIDTTNLKRLHSIDQTTRF